MKAVMVMYDSLRLDVLPSYGGTQIELPNFKRLAEHTAVFDNSYVCSMPCMPARREIHTGRANFLHRSWGPLEPFDDSMPELLRQNGVYTRIVTDHNHYVEDGGGTYCTRYSTWECNRGQEGDPWQGNAAPPPANPHTIPLPDTAPAGMRAVFQRMNGQDMRNRAVMREEADFPQARTFAQGVQFLEENHDLDRWFLQIETFDPHEPFHSPREYIARIFDPDRLGELDWPPYNRVQEDEDAIRSFRVHYLALVAFCDACLGKVLDVFDRYDLWKDTLLIVNTDHGFLLGEHGWWAKSRMPDYQEILHTPLFLWDPRSGVKGQRRASLVQTIDLAPTLLEYFGLPVPADMVGRPLGETVATDAPVRSYALMGYHAGALTVTDGRYKLTIAPLDNGTQRYEYTLMPTHMRARFSVEELRQAKLAPPFSFTKGCPVLRIPAPTKRIDGLAAGEELLFDLEADPREQHPITDAAVTRRLKEAIVALLRENSAPRETYLAYDLPEGGIGL